MNEDTTGMQNPIFKLVNTQSQANGQPSMGNNPQNPMNNNSSMYNQQGTGMGGMNQNIGMGNMDGQMGQNMMNQMGMNNGQMSQNMMNNQMGMNNGQMGPKYDEPNGNE